MIGWTRVHAVTPLVHVWLTVSCVKVSPLAVISFGGLTVDLGWDDYRGPHTHTHRSHANTHWHFQINKLLHSCVSQGVGRGEPGLVWATLPQSQQDGVVPMFDWGCWCLSHYLLGERQPSPHQVTRHTHTHAPQRARPWTVGCRADFWRCDSRNILDVTNHVNNSFFCACASW